MPGELDMRRMQEEAARRAREMQSRARIPQQRRGTPHPPQEETPPPAPPPPEPSPEEPPPAQPPAPPPVAESALGSLFQDKERTIILALLILLGNEDGNQELLFALLFLLM